MTVSSPTLPDQLADTLRMQQAVIHRLQQPLHRFGYAPVDTPLVEQADLFLIKAGDAAISRLLSFDLPGQTVCLRPEFTVPAARVYIEHFQDQPGTVRLQFAGPILRYQGLNHGQLRQQQAVGAELLNEYSIAADAEIIALAGKMLSEAGMNNWRLLIGHSGLVDRFLDRYHLNRQTRRFVLEWLPALKEGQLGVDRAAESLQQALQPAYKTTNTSDLQPGTDTETALKALLNATPQRGPIGSRTQEEVARRLLEKQQQTNQYDNTLRSLQDLAALLAHAETPQALLHYLDGDPLQSIAAHIVETFALLDAYGIPNDHITFDLSFTRNLEYYTGIVFEYRALHNGDRLLGGGGRYDELIQLLGAERRVPAVGFMLYVTPVLDASTAQEAASSTPTLLIQATAGDQIGALIRLASQLRDADWTVTTNLQPEHPLTDTSAYTHVLTPQSADTLLLHNTQTNTTDQLRWQDFPALLRTLE